jgi:hypothetical protein
VAAVLQWGDRKLTIPVRNNHASHPIGLSGEPIAPWPAIKTVSEARGL